MRKSQTAKSTIGHDPFATVIPLSSELDSPEAMIIEPKPVQTEEVREPRAVNVDRRAYTTSVTNENVKRGKQKLTVQLDPLLADRVKNAAYWNPRLTIAGIAEYGIKY